LILFFVPLIVHLFAVEPYSETFENQLSMRHHNLSYLAFNQIV
jgi:hypothetical protein